MRPGSVVIRLQLQQPQFNKVYPALRRI